MRITHIALLLEDVLPTAYGGIELIVGLLTNGLVNWKYNVTPFVSDDSITRAKLSLV